MNHDELCPAFKCPCETGEEIDPYECDHYCRCDLIAKADTRARADERIKTESRVRPTIAAMIFNATLLRADWSDFDGPNHFDLIGMQTSDILLAIRGESDE